MSQRADAMLLRRPLPPTRARASTSTSTSRRTHASRARPSSLTSPARVTLERPRVRVHGVPVLQSLPLVGWAFSTPVITVAYVFVAIRMFLRYDRTTFGRDVPPIAVCALWPVLAIVSASFRDNLRRAM